MLCICSSVSRLTPAQSGHQLPFRMLASTAFHRCPSAHCHKSGVFEFTYDVETHSPLLFLTRGVVPKRVVFFMGGHPYERNPFPCRKPRNINLSAGQGIHANRKC